MKILKLRRVIIFIGVLLFVFGVGKIIYKFIEIEIDNKKISRNIKEWDSKKIEVNKNDKNKINVDGKIIVGKIIVKKTGEQIPIIKGATEENLKNGATLYENGIYPGDKGTAIILGHRETTFGFLEDIKDNDEIEIEDLKNTYKFKVKKDYITNPEDSSIFEQKNYPSLTLITCYPFHYLGNAPDRFIVNLDLI
ncbi:class D sortase [Clostridium sardiniense]|uniref:Class D sortase n=1 Tax=Clostridium sardiniense TaxID=29369 RepID=A0ABS7L2V8_CLOSR|nr:class D sortase [Clostridium sardiniense]MBY0757203.1 class D sortase [Clostridium sardiniense]MDQ0462062.1 sortase A [Clostridium sardiniense]